MLYKYFKQLFAQVTNPTIDPYRESQVMSLMSFIGRGKYAANVKGIFSLIPPPLKWRGM